MLHFTFKFSIIVKLYLTLDNCFLGTPILPLPQNVHVFLLLEQCKVISGNTQEKGEFSIKQHFPIIGYGI